MISIVFNPSSIEEFKAACDYVRSLGIVSPVSLPVNQPVSITPPMPGLARRSPVFDAYKAATGQNFRIARGEAIASGWTGEMADCPETVKAAACRARMVSQGFTVPDEMETVPESEIAVNPAEIEISTDEMDEF